MLAQISKEDALWLVEEYGPKRGYRIDSTTFGMYLKAFNVMKGTDRKVDCMSCEGKTIAALAKSIYEQYEGEIKAIAYPPKKGRKKKNG